MAKPIYSSDPERALLKSNSTSKFLTANKGPSGIQKPREIVSFRSTVHGTTIVYPTMTKDNIDLRNLIQNEEIDSEEL